MRHLTIAQKIAAGYLLVSLFCLSAVVYALAALSHQTRLNQDLVRVDFATMSVLRDMRSNLLAQERLERQTLILRDNELTELLAERQADFHQLYMQFKEVDEHLSAEALFTSLSEFDKSEDQGLQLLLNNQWQEAGEFSEDILSPLRNKLVGQLEQFLQEREQAMDQQLNTLLETSRRAYSLTLSLAFAGTALAAMVALWVIFRINQAVGRLTRATREIASGSFDHPIDLHSSDEFGQLARDFQNMGGKLKELEQLRLDANPLTHLPGNLTIERELEERIATGTPFATLYVDLDHFKVYNDRYGYQAGSAAIAAVGDLVLRAVRNHGNGQDMVGHIGGDDYIVLSTPEHAEEIAREIVASFDRLAPSFYSAEDREAGHTIGLDRYGVKRQFPLMTVSIAVLTSNSLKDPSPVAIGRECAKIKEHLKKEPGSNYLIDRREQR